MSSSGKRYSREFKLEVVRRIQITGQSQREVADELGISPNTLSRWMRQFRDDKAEAFPGTGKQTSQAALIARLRRENERLRKERDFLKKTSVDSTGQRNTTYPRKTLRRIVLCSSSAAPA